MDTAAFDALLRSSGKCEVASGKTDSHLPPPTCHSPLPASDEASRQTSAAAVPMPPSAAVSAASAEQLQQAVVGSQLPVDGIEYLKGAGKRVPPGTANGPIECEDVQRPAVAAPHFARRALRAKTMDMAETEITLERVMEEVRRADLRPLWVGRYAALFSATRRDRLDALKQVKAAMVREHYVTAAARLDGFIAAYYVAETLGWDDAQTLVFDAIKALRRLVKQDLDTGDYEFRRNCERPARMLWARMVRTPMSAAAVRAEVSKIRPARSNPKLHGRAGAAAKLFKTLRSWKSQDDLLQALAIIQDRLAAMRTVNSQVA